MAVRAIRNNAKQDIKVGIAENSDICVPLMETPEHVEAARKAMREINGHFLTAMMEGAYPECYLTGEGPDAPEFTDEQMKIIGEKLDFVGINAYYPTMIRACDSNSGYEIVEPPESYPKMNMPWAHIGPQVVYWPVRFLKEIWNVDDVYITENGCAAKDKLTPDKEVLDTDRIMFLREHFIWAQRAVREGLPLKGYFVWSLLDNFEWARGFSKRFGLVYVNYRTLERTPKLSAHYYKQVIEQSAVV
jgi:beta-glucosidase